MDNQVKSVAIFAVYSTAYGNLSLRRFVDFVRSYDQRSKIVAVNNNPDLILSKIEGVDLVVGTNSCGEFSAWQEGLNHIKASFIKKPKIFIFGNDTFCVNRKMGIFEELSFIKSIKITQESKTKAICGEISTFNQSFTLIDSELQSWICSYLFAINSLALDAINWKISEDQDFLKNFVNGGECEDNFFSKNLDPVLRQHLVGWLFGRDEKPKWYKGESLTSENSGFFYKKANAIISEKLLSAKLKAKNTKFHSIFEPIAIRIIRKTLHNI